MFAINHAASALIFKKHLKDQVSFVWILLAVQFVELLWVLFNLLGIEKITTEETVAYVGDIHLSHMPYSHSIVSSMILTIVVGFAFWLWKRSWKVGVWMGLAVLSHILLDIITHAQDLPLGFSNTNFIGMGLYANLPVLGFLLELIFGVCCWWYYKGSKTLLWVIILFNISNISMFIPELPGLEMFMANKPLMITVVILAQILVTLFIVGWFSSKQRIYKLVVTFLVFITAQSAFAKMGNYTNIIILEEEKYQEIAEIAHFLSNHFEFNPDTYIIISIKPNLPHSVIGYTL